MKKTLFIPALIALLTGVSCQELENPSGEDGSSLAREIVLTGSVGDFTKITDAGFGNGDVAGLTIGQPVGASNVPITYASGTFTPSYTLYWAIGQQDSQKADFLASFPYLQDANLLEAFSFTVKPDQSAEGAIAASDLLTAYTQASPSDQTVNLSFSHALSRIVFDIDASITGESVVSVILEGIRTRATVDIKNGRSAAAGDPSNVKAGPAGNYLVAVAPPQEVNPAVVITTSKGRQLRFVPDQPLSLMKGKQIVAKIVIDNNSVVSFITDIIPWNSGEVVFPGKTPGGETGSHTWTLMVNGYYDDGPGYIEMEPQTDGTYTAVIEGSPYFVLIRDNEQYFGSVLNTNVLNHAVPGFEDDELEYPLILIDKSDIDKDVSHAGKVFNKSTSFLATVTLDPAKYVLTFKAVPHKWESIGKGKFIDGFFDRIIGDLPEEELEVDIDADAAHPGTYRIRDPYKNACWLPDFKEIVFEEGGELIFHIGDNGVWFSDTYSGLKRNGVPLYVSSLVRHVWWWAGESFFGTYDPANKFVRFTQYTAVHLGVYGDPDSYSMIYAGNRNGSLSITLPGGSRTERFDTLTDIHSYDPDGSGNTLEVGFYAGLDVESVEYAAVAGLLSADQAAASAQFTSLQGYKSGTYNYFDVPVINDGVFTVVLKANSSGGSKLYTLQKNAAYDRWIGSWDGFEILALEPGVSLVAREGYNPEDQPIDIILEFDQATGNLLFKYRVLDVMYANYYLFTSGITAKNELCQDPSVTIATFEWRKDGVAEIVPGVYNDSPFTCFGLYATPVDGGGVYYFEESDLPLTIYKY